MTRTSRDYQNVMAGALLIVIGVGAAYHAYTHFPIGTVSRMGPGMFPMWLGITLASLGALVAVPAFFRTGIMPRIDKRPALLVLLSAIVFALIIEAMGLVPAIFALTGCAVLADNKVRLLGTLVLGACLSLMAWLIFVAGLGIPVQAFVWPF